MKIYGYSERGMINSLMYRIGEDEELLKAFIKLISLPKSIDVEDANNFEIIIEQSLSQFGDADLIIIANYANNDKKVLFFEAKVKTSQGNWIIGNQFAKFTDKGKYNGYASNLFYQLRLKKILVNKLKGVEEPNMIEEGKSVGKNKIVNKTVEKIGEGTSHYYIGIIPTMDDEIKAFLDNSKNKKSLEEKCGKKLYFLSWKAIEDFCKNKKLQKVLEMFKYNEGQIY